MHPTVAAIINAEVVFVLVYVIFEKLWAILRVNVACLECTSSGELFRFKDHLLFGLI